MRGARLFLNVDEWTDPIELGTSDDDGTYRFEVSEVKVRRIVAPSFMILKKKASLIAVAKGLGPDWVELPSLDGARARCTTNMTATSTSSPTCRSLAKSSTSRGNPSPTITVDPARTISGVVRDAETGEPVAGVHVYVQAVVGPARATTDHQGRFHIQRSEDQSSLLVYTQSDPQRYLDVVHRLADTQGLGGVIEADLELPRGVAVTGRVLESGTGRPIVSAPDGGCHVQWPGPWQTGHVEYFPLASNTALRGSPTGLYFEGIQPGKANYYTSVPPRRSRWISRSRFPGSSAEFVGGIVADSRG